MEQLIKITNTDKGSVVSAKELYLFLGYDKTKWSRWSNRNIIDDDFFTENSDYVTLTHRVKGNETTDYAITISMAKELCMLAKTEKGKEARQYFIECEKIANQNTSILVLPSYQIENPAERARAWAVEYEEKQLLIENNAKLQFRSDFVDVCFDTDGVFDFSEVAKILKLGYGSITLYKKMREHNVIMKNDTVPYQKFINNGYFKVVEKLIENGSFKKLITTTFATQKGVGYIHKLLKDELTA